MGLLKDWKEDNEGYRFQTQVTHLFDPREWKRLAKWRYQRANRGYSDRDMWGAGEHIAKLVAVMLADLDKGHTDWPEWFKLNVQEEGKGAYKNLQQVVDDINNYLEHEKTSWADGLYCDTAMVQLPNGNADYNQKWYDEKTNKLQTDAAIKHRINKWSKENARLYKKSTKAMQFFGRHYASFWD